MKNWIMIFALLCAGFVHPAGLVPPQAADQEFLPYETEQYFYTVTTSQTPTDSDEMIEPVVVSDTIVNNYFNSGKTRTLIIQETKDGQIITMTQTWKTKNPSYLTKFNGGMAVVATVGAACMIFYMKKLYDQELVHEMAMLKKAIQYENNDAQRYNQLKTEFGSRLNDSQYFIIANLVQDFDQQKYENFTEKIHEAMGDKKVKYDIKKLAISSSLLDDHEDEKDVIVYKVKKIPIPTKLIVQVYENLIDSDTSVSLDLSDKDFYQYAGIANNKYVAAAHEAGHILMNTENMHLTAPSYGTAISLPGSGGHMVQIASDSFGLIPVSKKDLTSLKSSIAVDLSGGVAMQIAEGKKLDFDQFLLEKHYGMGDRDSKDSDIYHAYQTAKKYLQFKKGDTWLQNEDLVKQEKEIHDLLQDQYNKAYDALYAKKDKLVQLTNKLFEQSVISDKKIHEIVGTQQPKYFVDQPWYQQDLSVLWNAYQHAVKFHHKNAYEIHQALS